MPYDLIVIGSGPAGYVCAIRAAQLGLKTAVVEKCATYGGTCLNIGCIPSKALLHASELFEEAGHGFAAFGIDVPAPKLNLDAMMAHKDATVKANVDGVAFLFKKNKIDGVRGTGPHRGARQGRGQGRGRLDADARDEVDRDRHGLRSDGAPGRPDRREADRLLDRGLELPTPPKRLLVVGAGIIGLELGSVWRRLGSQVEVIEYLDRILPGMDAETAKQFQRLMEKQGAKFHLSRKVTKAELTKNASRSPSSRRPAGTRPPWRPMSCSSRSGDGR